MANAKKILIAEDDPFLSKVTGNHLKAEGFEIDMVNDGAQALDKIKKNNYDLILLDLVMPVKNGFEVLQELKKDNVKIPVMVFTSLAQDEDREEVMNLGAKGYYVKYNIIIDELIEIIRRELIK